MARGSCPTATGQRPAADFPAAAGRPRALAAAWLSLLAVAAGLDLIVAGLANAQTAGQGDPASSVAGVTVTAPPRIGGQDKAAPCPTRPGQPASGPACAAATLDQAAKAAQAAAPGAPGLQVPSARSPAASVGVGTPAAAAQQPGTPFGKPPGYVPPRPPAIPGGPFTRGPR
jgi:hypothetical protein